MTCREVLDFLLDYLALELPEPQVAEFERHLAACPSCVAYLKSYEQTIQLSQSLADAAPDAPPAELANELPEDLVAAILKARTQP